MKIINSTSFDLQIKKFDSKIRGIKMLSILPSPSYSLATLRARDEAISGTWAAGIITSKIASLYSAYSLTYEGHHKIIVTNL